jgi:hypothetical protein
VNSTGDAHAGGDLTNGVCQTAASNSVCTLRAAIEKADYWPGGGVTINFGGVTPPATYTLSFGALVISNTMTIAGAGPSATIIDGNGAVTNDRVINVITHTVSLSGVTITNGKQSGLNAFGGGILHNDALTLTNSVVSRNSATSTSGGSYGGGIYSSGRLTLINSAVLSNTATTASGIAAGGGIIAGFALTLINSTVSGNTTPGDGGGIEGGVTLIASTVSGNTARNGGGINGGALTLLNSTVSGNYANDNGGGVYQSGGAMGVFNATITRNTANAKASGSGFGGGVANASGTVNFQNTIIAGNFNVLIVNGHPVLNPEDCSGTLSSQGYNIVSDTTDCTINGSFTQADPALGPLQDNGGPTLTHLPQPGSPAVDAGQPGNCTDSFGAPIVTDQRGIGRPQGARCDIGAVEVQVPTQLAFAVQPGGAASGAPLSPQPVVRADDAFRALVPSYAGAVTLTIGTNPAGGTLGGTTSVAATGGVAAYSGLSIDRAGAGYTLVASAAGLAPTTSAPFDIAAPATSTPTPTPTSTATATATPTSTATPAGATPRAFLPLLRR